MRTGDPIPAAAISEDVLRQRAFDRLIHEERQRAQVEYQSQVDALQAANAARAAEVQRREGSMINQLKTLAPDYHKRAELAAAALAALTDFCEVDAALVGQVDQLLRGLGDAWSGTSEADKFARLAQLRRAAGLPPQHFSLGVNSWPDKPAAIAAMTAIAALTNGMVIPGVVKIGDTSAFIAVDNYK